MRQLHGCAQQQYSQVQRPRRHLCCAVTGAQAGALQAVVHLRMSHAHMTPSNVSTTISCASLKPHCMHSQVCRHQLRTLGKLWLTGKQNNNHSIHGVFVTGLSTKGRARQTASLLTAWLQCSRRQKFSK